MRAERCTYSINPPVCLQKWVLNVCKPSTPGKVGLWLSIPRNSAVPMLVDLDASIWTHLSLFKGVWGWGK